jgi:hypothetical protein
MKQTAVEWFEDQVGHNSIMGLKEFNEIFEKAKEMEKYQIEDAYRRGIFNGQSNWGYGNDVTAEKYYKETYESKTNI